MRPDVIAQQPADKRLTRLAAITMLASMALLLQSYALVKLAFIALFLAAVLVNVVLGRTRVVVYPRLLRFYLWVAFAGAAWGLVGFLRAANFAAGTLDSMKLYVVWSAAFAVLYTLLRAEPSLSVVHRAMVAAGILIPVVNLVGLSDQLSGLGLLPASVRQELNMEIGFGDGYIQYGSENLRAMFVVAPYLVALQFRADTARKGSRLTRLALVLSLVLVAISGRRALWLVVALAPVVILLLSVASGALGRLRPLGRRLLLAWAASGVVGMGLLLALPEDGIELATLARLRQAFSAQDERALQAPHLIDGFGRMPLLGSGFGGYADYQRSDEAPWKYELTYHTMLFNLGALGTGLLVGLYGLCLLRVVRILRSHPEGSAIPFGLVVGVLSLFAGAYTNPYFGGFEALFFAGLLPYLATFEQGFELGEGRPDA